MTEDRRPGPGTIRELLRGQPAFPAALPEFDPATAPADPVPLFARWLSDAVAAGVRGPQAMTLATADAAGQVSSRVVICDDVDDTASWYFAADADSGKGRDLAANASAAVSFYWPDLGRQIRVRGAVSSTGPAASAADFLARTPDSRAATLAGAGRQSTPLDSRAELAAAFRAARERIDTEPGLVAPGHTRYALAAAEAEFWQGNARRQHVRLRYQRLSDAGGAWARQLLWP